MNWHDTLSCKALSFIVLLFFSWTFGGLFDIAYAVKVSDQQSAIAGQNNKKKKRPEEKLNESIGDIEQILTDISTDFTTKKNKIKTRKTEIESFDTEIKKQFADTEKKLKDSGLPQKILKRHYDFVKKYEDNLNELVSNLGAIDKAQTDAEVNSIIEKTKTHLKKLKPPKKHKPLDPNKLPHRSAEPVYKEPRTKPEEFKKEQLAFNNQELDELPLHPLADNSFFSDHTLIASNGSIEGILNPRIKTIDNDELWKLLHGEEGTSINSNTRKYGAAEETSLSDYIMLAQASNPPTAADLTETIEVQFTPAIAAKAAELENNPLKIYEWVRNNIEFVPTYGSIQGADYCLQTKLCNAFDTSSLLIALLRVSGIHARYAEGTVEIPIEKVKNWLGGFTDSNAALGLLASAGIPTSGMTVGGVIKYVRMEHIWVEAWIDYIHSRGSRHFEGDTWIPLDASFKQYSYTQGLDIQSAVPFDAQSFVDQIHATATINETEGYVTDVDSLFIDQTMTDYQTQVENYINQNYPDATVDEVLGTKEIMTEEFPIFLGTLPYRTIAKGTSYSDIPDALRHKINFSVVKDLLDELSGTPIKITKSLPELAGKKITLSYAPATPDDEAVINSSLPEPHADGTPIDPTELPTSLSAYLINLKPELRINGALEATGTEIGIGATEVFKLTFSSPNMSDDVITNDIEAGEYIGIGLDLGRISDGQMLAIKIKLESTKSKLEMQDFTNLTKDDILGDLLYTTAISYYAELDVIDAVQSQIMGVSATRLPSEALFSHELKINKFMDMPVSVESGGLSMDIDRAMLLTKALHGDNEKPKQFMLSSGMNSSALEHSVPEQFFSTVDNPAEGVSAVKALKIANDQGIPIYIIDQGNIDSIIPQLQIDGGTIQDIQNAVSAGKQVVTSKTDITFNEWTGVGYIIIDPATGEGAYMISGGTNGAWMVALLWLLIALLILSMLIIAALIGPLALLIVTFLMPVYIGILIYFAQYASETARNCFKSLAYAYGELRSAIVRLILGDDDIKKDPKSHIGFIAALIMSMKKVSEACF